MAQRGNQTMTALEKRRPFRSKAITQAANGEACTVCGRNDGTTVFCHLNESWAGKGMGQKADDFAGFFGCELCHTAYDNKGKPIRRGVEYRLNVEDWEIMRAMYRTWRRLLDRGILLVKE